MASQSSTPSFEPVDSKSIEEAIEEDLSFVMADEAIDKVADEMSKSKYSQVIFKSVIVQKFTSLDFFKNAGSASAQNSIYCTFSNLTLQCLDVAYGHTT